MQAADFIQRLHTCRYLLTRYDDYHQPYKAPLWIRGTLAFSQHDGYLRQTETGRYEHKQREISTHNCYQWRVIGSSLQLSHCRQSLDTPIGLTTFDCDHPPPWQGQPHHCGEDIYEVQIELQNSAIRLIWQVSGPTKNYQLTTDYNRL